MTFKQLANELIEQGWRCYHLPDIATLSRGDSLHRVATRNNLEIQSYEDKFLVFVRTILPKIEKQKK